MAQKAIKYEGSKYKYVKRLHCNDHSYWAMNIPGVTKKKLSNRKRVCDSR